MENHIQMDLGQSKDKDWYLLLTCAIMIRKAVSPYCYPLNQQGWCSGE